MSDVCMRNTGVICDSVLVSGVSSFPPLEAEVVPFWWSGASSLQLLHYQKQNINILQGTINKLQRAYSGAVLGGFSQTFNAKQNKNEKSSASVKMKAEPADICE